MKDKALKNLKAEIDNRKKGKEVVAEGLGENTTTAIPKDSFLHELAQSLKSGQPSNSTNIIKLVENKVAEKNNETPVHSEGSTGTLATELTKHVPTPHQNIPPQQHNNNGDREALLYEELERKKKEMLSGGAANINLNQPQQTTHQAGMVINEAKLYETVDNVIKDKFAHIVEQAMKDSIVEIYAQTRMKEVLEENKDTIKKMVYDTIRDLQQKNKKSQ